MTEIDKDSPEFKQAVADAIAAEVEGFVVEHQQVGAAHLADGHDHQPQEGDGDQPADDLIVAGERDHRAEEGQHAATDRRPPPSVRRPGEHE